MQQRYQLVPVKCFWDPILSFWQDLKCPLSTSHDTSYCETGQVITSTKKKKISNVWLSPSDLCLLCKAGLWDQYLGYPIETSFSSEDNEDWWHKYISVGGAQGLACALTDRPWPLCCRGAVSITNLIGVIQFCLSLGLELESTFQHVVLAWNMCEANSVSLLLT